MLATAERWADYLASALALVAGLILLCVAVLGVLDAGFRYALSAPITGTIEVTELLLAVVIFAALPYATATNQHVVIDSFANRLAPSAQWALKLLGATTLAIMFAVISWQMAILAVEYFHSGRTTLSSRIPVLPFLLLSLFAMIAATTVAIVRCLALMNRSVHSS